MVSEPIVEGTSQREAGPADQRLEFEIVDQTSSEQVEREQQLLAPAEDEQPTSESQSSDQPEPEQSAEPESAQHVESEPAPEQVSEPQPPTQLLADRGLEDAGGLGQADRRGPAVGFESKRAAAAVQHGCRGRGDAQEPGD